MRHDIQVLADYGAITGPVTTWPIAWDAVLHDLERIRAEEIVLPNRVMPTYERMLARARREAARGGTSFSFGVAAAEAPTNIRGFADTPREELEAEAGIAWAGSHFSIDVNVAGVESPESRLPPTNPQSIDSDTVRLDGSQLSLDLGNWSIGASTLDRWWGPGWDGSLILSNNARPIPSLVIGRNLTDAFETKWLSWLGPWDLQVMFGQLERDSLTTDSRFWGMRLNFRPFRGFEIGVSRTATFCGEGRPCDLSTFWNMFLGRDNASDDGITYENEPGNQMAGFDARWTNMWFGTPLSAYGQLIGDDEAGGLPSRYLALFGIEVSGISREQTSWRWFAEAVSTSCDALKNPVLFDCAYRYSPADFAYASLGRIIGHGLDADSRVVSTGIIAVSASGSSWLVLGRVGELNRAGATPNHTVAPDQQDMASIDIQHTRDTRFGRFDIGVGFERREDMATGVNTRDTRGFLRWSYAWGHGNKGR